MKEIRIEDVTLQELKQQIHALRDSEDILVIRGGGRKYDRDQWARILRKDFDLELDERQYNFQEKLELVTWWEISYQPDKATSYAYSNTRQPLHNDNAWFADPAEVNFFMMVKQAIAGGEQVVYPLSRIAEDVSREQPGLFHDLCNTTVVIKKGDGEYFNKSPILVLGDQPRIFWNFYRTEKPTAEIRDMCDAFFKFLESKESTPSVERRRSETGDCMAFNDQRLLHGRAAFTATKPFDRVLLQSMWRLPKADSASVAA